MICLEYFLLKFKGRPRLHIYYFVDCLFYFIVETFSFIYCLQDLHCLVNSPFNLWSFQHGDGLREEDIRKEKNPEIPVCWELQILSCCVYRICKIPTCPLKKQKNKKPRFDSKFCCLKKFRVPLANPPMKWSKISDLRENRTGRETIEATYFRYLFLILPRSLVPSLMLSCGCRTFQSS